MNRRGLEFSYPDLPCNTRLRDLVGYPDTRLMMGGFYQFVLTAAKSLPEKFQDWKNIPDLSAATIAHYAKVMRKLMLGDILTLEAWYKEFALSLCNAAYIDIYFH